MMIINYITYWCIRLILEQTSLYSTLQYKFMLEQTDVDPIPMLIRHLYQCIPKFEF
jgi:hypothetical protein